MKDDNKYDSLQEIDAFTIAYIECMLWVECDNADESGGQQLEYNYDIEDIAPETLASIVEDCKDFQAENEKLLTKAGNDEQNGQDFWLTRNQHGAGYWDRGYGVVGEILTDAAYVYGCCDVYVGDDGKLYI